MKKKSEKIDQIFLWFVLAGGILCFLFYGLSSFLARPTVETITTGSQKSNSGNERMDIKYQNRNSR